MIVKNRGSGYTRPTPLGPRIVIFPGGGVIPRASMGPSESPMPRVPGGGIVIAPPSGGMRSGFPIIPLPRASTEAPSDLPPWAPDAVSSSTFTPEDQQAVQGSAAAAAVFETPAPGDSGPADYAPPDSGPAPDFGPARPTAADFDVNPPPPQDYAPPDFGPADFGPPAPSAADFEVDPGAQVDAASGEISVPPPPPPPAKKPATGLLLGLGTVAAIFLGLRR